MIGGRVLAALILASALACADREASADVAGSSAAAAVRAALPSFRDATPPTRSAAALEEPRAWIAAGRRDEARARLEALAPEEPTGEAAFLAGWLHHEDERYALAADWLARALAHGPTFPKARRVFFLYGRSLQETGDLEGARAAYEADDELFPAEGDAAFRLAQLDLESGDLASCEARARDALARFERPRDVAKTHALLGDVHLARDELGEARAAYERCVAAFPHYEVFYKLSRLCARMGDEEAAARFMEEHRRWRERAGR